jgi:hypothetical protein
MGMATTLNTPQSNRLGSCRYNRSDKNSLTLPGKKKYKNVTQTNIHAFIMDIDPQGTAGLTWVYSAKSCFKSAKAHFNKFLDGIGAEQIQ